MKELREGLVKGHFAANYKILDVKYWWPILFKDTHDFFKSCGSCQKIGKFKTKNLDRLVTTLQRNPL